MDLRKLKCSCGQEFFEEEFKKHYTQCQPFIKQFKELDIIFGDLLKLYSEPKDNLLIIKFLLEQYMKVIDKKLFKYYANLRKNPPQPAPYQNGNVPPPFIVGNAPPGMSNNMTGMSQNPYNQSGINKNNPYRNPYQNQNQNPHVNQNQNKNNNPYVNKNKNNNPYANQNQNNNPYSNQNQNNNPYANQNKNENPYKSSSNPFAQPGNMGNNNNNNNNNNKNDFENDFNPQPIQIEDDNNPTLCQKCKVNSEVFYLSCIHPFCAKCFKEYADETNFYDMKCLICSKPIYEAIKKEVLGPEKTAELERKALMKLYGGEGNIIKCPYQNCGAQFSFEPGKVDYNVRDDQNKRLSKEAAEDYAKNRCRCLNCKKDFCKNCKAMPYHLGFNCDQFISRKTAKKCRYCDREIKAFNRGEDDDVCNERECSERFYMSCKKRLPCGHKCFGVNNERECPPCIDKECKQFGGQFGQNKDDYCIICYSEGLGSSPMVVLSCGHYIHYFCIKKRLETKWIGPKITFNHCLCPSCNKWFDCPSIPELQRMIDENKKLYEQIKEMALKRLKFEDLDKDPRLSDPNSPWFGKKEEFAMKRLSYYMCYVCKKPYFAGRRECGNDPNMNNDDPNKNYNPKDCVCGKDANLSGVAGKTNCDKHGKDFIEYKCKFCCKIASWFCWGTTHFCEDCHKRQCNKDYVSKYHKDRLPRCNPATCEVGGKHPPNGEEFALGCSICRNNEENAKDF